MFYAAARPPGIDATRVKKKTAGIKPAVFAWMLFPGSVGRRRQAATAELEQRGAGLGYRLLVLLVRTLAAAAW